MPPAWTPARRRFLASAMAGLAAVAGCNSIDQSNPGTEPVTGRGTTSTLVIENEETHTVGADESYEAINWGHNGALILEDGAILEVTETTA